MDDLKKADLLALLAGEPEPQAVPIDAFFDGNDDLGSIGCNLMDHPGIPRFREVLTGLLQRDDVEAVFARISELDPGDGCWPFADTVLGVGAIAADDLREAVSSLQPDEVGIAQDYGAASDFLAKYRSPVHAVWWD